jgi:hypothetical protein
LNLEEALASDHDKHGREESSAEHLNKVEQPTKKEKDHDYIISHLRVVVALSSHCDHKILSRLVDMGHLLWHE